MSIARERDKSILRIHQQSFLEKLVFKFLIGEAKTVSVPLAGHFQFSLAQIPTMDEEKRDVEG